MTDRQIQAVYAGTETTAFANSSLPKDNWLYLDIVQKDGGEIVPKEGDPLITPREGDPATTPVYGEILGLNWIGYRTWSGATCRNAGDESLQIARAASNSAHG